MAVLFVMVVVPAATCLYCSFIVLPLRISFSGSQRNDTLVSCAFFMHFPTVCSASVGFGGKAVHFCCKAFCFGSMQSGFLHLFLFRKQVHEFDIF